MGRGGLDSSTSHGRCPPPTTTSTMRPAAVTSTIVAVRSVPTHRSCVLANAPPPNQPPPTTPRYAFGIPKQKQLILVIDFASDTPGNEKKMRLFGPRTRDSTISLTDLHDVRFGYGKCWLCGVGDRGVQRPAPRTHQPAPTRSNPGEREAQESVDSRLQQPELRSWHRSTVREVLRSAQEPKRRILPAASLPEVRNTIRPCWLVAGGGAARWCVLLTPPATSL